MPSNGANLNLDVNLLQGFRAYVNIDQSRIDRLVELAETRDKTNRPWKKLLFITEELGVKWGTLLDTLVRIGTENAARDSAAETEDTAKALHHSTVDPMCDLECSN